MTKVLHIPDDPAEADRLLLQAAAILRRGGLVAFPTETVYGLGAVAHDEQAVAAIFRAKGRPAENPLIVHIADPAGVRQVAADWPPNAETLARRFWPGPLTLVVPKRPEMSDLVTAGGPTVAVRIPGHWVAWRLIELTGAPLAAPSANRSGLLSPTTADHVLRDLDGQIDLVLDAGPASVGLESTVLNLALSPPQLLRPGHITIAQIQDAIGPIGIGTPHLPEPGIALPSPGMLDRHYAPRTPTELIRPGESSRISEWLAAGLRVARLVFNEASSSDSGVVIRRLPADPIAYAAGLYAALHELDAAGFDRLLIDEPPADEDWRAVRDRLRRAAAHD